MRSFLMVCVLFRPSYQDKDCRVTNSQKLLFTLDLVNKKIQ
jgi:hypothetical protein